MKEEDVREGRRPERTDDSYADEVSTDRPRGAGFGLAVFLMAAFALGAIRRRLARYNERIYRQGYGPRASGEYGSSPRTFVWWTSRNGEGFTSGAWGTQTDAGRFRRTQQFWDEYIEEELRKERIRRMQQAFHREKARSSRRYEKWQEHPGYWEAGRSWESVDGNTSSTGSQRSQAFRRAGLIRHYEVLGLDPTREKPYSEVELKAAFRLKAMEHHPDRNINSKVESEKKFREVVESYEALRAQNRKQNHPET